MRDNRPSQRGFTLLELIAVMAIISAVTAIGLIVMKKDVRASDVAQQTAVMVREGQRRAIGGGRVRDDVQAALASGPARARLWVSAENANGERVASLELLVEGPVGLPLASGWQPLSTYTFPREVRLIGYTDAAVLTDGQAFTPLGAASIYEVFFYPDGRISAGTLGQGATLYFEYLQSKSDFKREARTVIMPLGGTVTTMTKW